MPALSVSRRPRSSTSRRSAAASALTSPAGNRSPSKPVADHLRHPAEIGRDHGNTCGKCFADDERRILNPCRGDDQNIEIPENRRHSFMGDRATPSNRLVAEPRRERLRVPVLAVIGPAGTEKVDDDRTGRQLFDRVDQHVRSFGGQEATGKSHAQRTGFDPPPFFKRRKRNPLIAARKAMSRDTRMARTRRQAWRTAPGTDPRRARPTAYAAVLRRLLRVFDRSGSSPRLPAPPDGLPVERRHRNRSQQASRAESRSRWPGRQAGDTPRIRPRMDPRSAGPSDQPAALGDRSASSR